MIDYIGPSVGALYSCSIILLGALLTAGAASAGNYGLMLFAQIIFGFGSSTLETSQSKLYAFYTLGSSMQGAIFGLDIAMGRVFNLCGKLSSVPIMERANSYAMTFWVRFLLSSWLSSCTPDEHLSQVAAIFAGVSFALATSFFFYERTFHPSARVPTGRQAARDARARGEDVVGAGSHWKANRLAFLRSIWAIPAAFFLLDISQLFQCMSPCQKRRTTAAFAHCSRSNLARLTLLYSSRRRRVLHKQPRRYYPRYSRRDPVHGGLHLCAFASDAHRPHAAPRRLL